VNIRTELAKQALEKSLEIREEYQYDFRSPLCIYELCERAKVKVQFVNDVSMEGIYAALAKPTILLSALRPLMRRSFTCAHELGHHVFGHGSTIDELKDEAAEGKFQPNEFLVDSFAGFLLMPAQGIKRTFSARSIELAKAKPEQIYAAACSFGVGYETLIGHLEHAVQYITGDHGTLLRKTKLPQIRERLLSFAAKEPLMIVDRQYPIGAVDVEIGTLVLLPAGTIVESDHIEFFKDVPNGRVFRAMRPGLARAAIPAENWGVMVRVSRYQYAGLARYRHLEETDSE
jgi:Zn-dependent peptidase ImmA (M78 family)